MELTPGRVERLQELFERTLALPPAERAAFLDLEAAGDRALRDDVLALVAAHEGGGTVLSRPIDLGAPAPRPAEAERWLGRRLGPWRVTRVVGQGGIGTVCEAERADEQFHKRAAVKFLHRQVGLPAAVQRFRVERQILAGLDHPNVATLLDGGVTDEGEPYLVMEYVDGEPITAWAEAQGASRRERVALFLQVCAAVEAAHRNLIVHRDLKPGNILVTRDGRAKLLDFGIARLLDDGAAQGGVQAEAQGAAEPPAYTPDYAAPEQLKALPVTTATDVYALGIVLYRLLAGRAPFERRTTPDVPAAPAGLDPDLDAILARALEIEPARRYATVGELRADLERWLEGRPVAAHPGGRRYRAGKFLRRHGAASAVVGVAAVAILAAAAVAIGQGRAAQRSAADLQRMNDFLMEVLRMSDPFAEGEELTLSAALDRAAELIDERFAGRPDLSAQVRYGIGYSMAGRYRLEQAEVQLERALRESRAEFGPRDVRTLQVVDGLAGLRVEQSRYEAAEQGYRSVIDTLEATRRQSDPLYPKALGNLGNVYLQQERYADADRLLRQAQDAQAGAASLPALDRAHLLSNLAHAAHGLEDHARADRLYREARAALEAQFPDGSPDLAILANNHALLHEDRGDLATALPIYRESLAMRRKVFRNEHPMVVTALGALARVQLATGDPAGALAHAREGVAIADRVYTEPNRFHPSVHATLASALLADDDLPGARESWARAKRLLDRFETPPASTARWVETVRGQLCARDPGAPPCAAGASPRAADTAHAGPGAR